MSGEKDFESSEYSDDDLVRASTETVGGAPSQRSLFAQSELRRRLMESIRALDRTTSRYSQILIGLSVVIGLIALIQLCVSLK